MLDSVMNNPAVLKPSLSILGSICYASMFESILIFESMWIACLRASIDSMRESMLIAGYQAASHHPEQQGVVTSTVSETQGEE